MRQLIPKFMSEYKLLLLDVDGVLVKSKDAPISLPVTNAIKKVIPKIYISLCTGRTREDIQRILKALNIKNSYHVIESGAKILNPDGNEENIKFIPARGVKQIVKIAGKTPSGYGFCVNGVWVENLKEITDGKVTTVSLHSYSQAQTQKILTQIKPVNEKYFITIGSHWTIPGGNFILITDKQATKGQAIKYVQNKLNIRKVDTITVGDMPNDLPLFENSDLKIAMGNADKQLKQNADYIAPSIDENGVADVINRFILNI